MTASIPTPDVYRWPQISQIDSAVIRDGHIELTWVNGEQSRFHGMWLRDQCACESCTHPVTREQRINLLDIDEDIAALSADIDASGGLQVVWNQDSHQSLYDPGWLYAHSGLLDAIAIDPETWTASELPTPPEFDGPEMMQSDTSLLSVCEQLCRTGIVLLHDLPTDTDTVQSVAYRFGPIRESHFERVFNVISRADADSNAYTSDELPAHTDMPTRETPHGLQLLHCLKNEARGGEAIMVDGFRIAEEIRRHHPQDFETLTTQPWTFANRAGESDYRWSSPLFELDANQTMISVRLAAFLRAPLIAEFDQVEPAYRALRRFITLTYDPDFRMTFDYAPGDLVIFDNRRVLHARGAFDPGTGHRHLQGTYIDRDDLYSTLRVLRHRLTA